MASVSAVEEATGQPVRIKCQFLAARDGVRSVLEAIEHATVTELHHPFRWPTPDRRRSVLEASDALRVSPAALRGPDAARAQLDPLHARGPAHRHDRGLAGRVRVVEPMRDRRFYLTGDAAHLITAAGGVARWR